MHYSVHVCFRYHPIEDSVLLEMRGICARTDGVWFFGPLGSLSADRIS